MVEDFPGLCGPHISYPIRFLCQCISRFSFEFLFDFLFPMGDGLFSFRHNQSLEGALLIFFRLIHSLHPPWTIRYFLSKGIRLPMCVLHSHHPVWSVTAPLLVTQPVPHFTRILPFPTLVSMAAPAIVLLLFVAIRVLFPLINLLLLRSCPSNHGLSIVVIPPFLLFGRSSYDHDDSSFIPVWIPAPSHLTSYCASLITCTLSWRIDSDPCHSLMPYVTCCMQFIVCTFPTILSVARVLLSYPHRLFMLILHGH
jgi:hypothetical protein